MGYGFGGHVGIAREAAWGTAVAVTSGSFIEALSESLALSIDRFQAKNIIGGALAEPDDLPGLRRLAGQIVIPAHPLQLGYFLKGAFGLTSTITVVLSGFLWESDFRPQTNTSSDDGVNNPLPSWTFEIFRDVTSSHRYAGSQISKLRMEVQGNQDLRVTADIVAKTTSVFAKSTPTFPSSPTLPFTFDTTSIQLAGSAVDFVETLAVEYDNQIQGIPTLNNTFEVSKMRRSGPQLVRVSGVMGFDNLTDYNRFVQQSEANLVASWTKTDSFQLVLRVPRLIYSAYPATMPGRDRLTVAFQGLGRRDTTLGYALQARLTTVKSDYGV